ncbi:MAG: hypothetical protein IKJ30_04480 [Bacilli bacterium]|nr:hypothetical protein [Bacilli bacterium]
MKIFELISYKTCYYYLKDTSNLDLSGYKFEEDMLQDALEVYKEDDEGYLCEMFNENMYGGSEDIIEIKTNYGSIIFHKGDDHDYVKEFLKHNSKNSISAFFASFRVSDDYIFAYAENGEIKRYMCNSEDGCLLEGKKTQAEIDCNLDYTLEDEYSFIEPYVDEDDIVNLASKIIPFDTQKDVEVLSINYYSKVIELDDKSIPTRISSDLVANIHNNLKEHNERVAGITLNKAPNSNLVYLLSFFMNSDDVLYADIIDLNNKEEFITSISRSLNVLSNIDYSNNPGHISKTQEVLEFIRNNANIKQVSITTNIKYPNMISISKVNKKSLLPKILDALINLKTFKNFNSKNIENIYEFCLKKLK